MKAYKYRSKHPHEIISNSVFIADSFFRRLFGLLLRKSLKSDEIFILKNCRSIHTIGMRYILDVVFLDDKGKVIAVFENLCPWRVTPYIREAISVLEARSGFLKKWSLDVGDRIMLE
jgi:uncharacterized membrane protein (UPF0127 family)